MRLTRVRRLVRDSYAIGRLATTRSRLLARGRDTLTRLLPESIDHRRLAVYASEAALRRQLQEAAAITNAPTPVLP